MNSAGRPRPLTPARDSIRRVDAGACREGPRRSAQASELRPVLHGRRRRLPGRLAAPRTEALPSPCGPEHDGAGARSRDDHGACTSGTALARPLNRVATSSGGATASVAPTAWSMYRLSEPEPLSRPGVSGCGVGDRSAGARAYLGPRPLRPVTRWLMGRSAGDDSDRSVLLGAPPETDGSRDTFGSGSEALRASQ